MKEQISEVELNQAYRETFASKSGSLVLRHLVREHGLLRQAFVDGDSHATSFNDGGRNVIIQLLRRIHTDEEIEKQVIQQGVDYDYDI